MTYIPETDQTRAIRSIASAVATYLRTRHEPKKHGGYDIYEDDKIVVVLDTYVPNLNISIKQSGHATMVFSASYQQSPSEFHPGRWIDYLTGLAEKAGTVRETREAEKNTREQQLLSRLTGPVDDTALFKEAAP